MERHFDIAISERIKNNIAEIQVKNKYGKLNLLTGEAEISEMITILTPEGKTKKVRHITNFVVEPEGLKRINAAVVTQN